MTLGTGNVTIEVHLVRRSAAALPTTILDHLVSGPDNTARWIDAERVRHWIPDGPTYECLAARFTVVDDPVAGYAIAALRFGPSATC